MVFEKSRAQFQFPASFIFLLFHLLGFTYTQIYTVI